MKIMVNAAAHELIAQLMAAIEFKTIFIGDPLAKVERGPDNGGDTLVVGLCPCTPDIVIVEETTITPAESQVTEWRTYRLVSTVDDIIKEYNAHRVHQLEQAHNEDAFEGLLRKADSDVSSAVGDILPEVSEDDDIDEKDD